MHVVLRRSVCAGQRAVGHAVAVVVVVLDKVLDGIAQEGLQSVELFVYGVLETRIVLLHVVEVDDQRVALRLGELPGFGDVLFDLFVLGIPGGRRTESALEQLVTKLEEIVAKGYQLFEKVLEQLLNLLTELVFDLRCLNRFHFPPNRVWLFSLSYQF